MGGSRKGPQTVIDRSVIKVACSFPTVLWFGWLVSHRPIIPIMVVKDVYNGEISPFHPGLTANYQLQTQICKTPLVFQELLAKEILTHNPLILSGKGLVTRKGFMIWMHLSKSGMCYFARGYKFLEGPEMQTRGWNLHHLMVWIPAGYPFAKSILKKIYNATQNGKDLSSHDFSGMIVHSFIPAKVCN